MTRLFFARRVVGAVLKMITGSREMTQPTESVAEGKMVSITYTIHEVGGALLEQVDAPVSYLHGSGRLLPKVEAALESKVAGDTVSVELDSSEAFGPHRDELTYVDDLVNVPEQFRFLGAEVEMMSDKGERRTFAVTRIEAGKLTLDGNHPFAGKALQFDLTVCEVRAPTPEEVASLGSVTRH